MALTVGIFGVASGAVENERLVATRTIEANYRANYDVLVRPPGTRLALEEERNLVRPGFSSEIVGGITLEQLDAIRAIEGVEVAAPLAVVGLAPLQVFTRLDVTDLLGNAPRALLRYETNINARNGSFETPGWYGYAYLTTQPVDSGTDGRVGAFTEMVDGQVVHPCAEPRYRVDTEPPSAFPFSGCLSPQGPNAFFTTTDGRYLTVVGNTVWPTTLAAIDPGAEQALTGLGAAITKGDYLNGEPYDTSAVFNPSGYPRPLTIPVIFSTDLGESDYTIEASAQIASTEALQLWLDSPPEGREDLLDTIDLFGDAHQYSLPANDTYRDQIAGMEPVSDLATEFPEQAIPVSSYAQVGPVSYDSIGSTLAAQQLPAPSDAELRLTAARDQPATLADSGYRTWQPQRLLSGVGEACVDDPLLCRPEQLLAPVGFYDPKLLDLGSDSQGAPLDLYRTPEVRAADESTRSALGSDVYLPDLNPRGYLTGPPGALMSLSSLSAFAETWPELLEAPLSSIRVRVSGVTGFNAESAERIRLVAEAIATSTGLSVDITTGSALSRQRVDLPASEKGVPALALTELWTSKGASVQMSSALDAKSVLFAGLLLVSVFTAAAACTSAMVRRRRTELAVLATVGWRPATVARSLLGELAVLGAFAGLLGAAVSLGVSAAVGFQPSATRAPYWSRCSPSSSCCCLECRAW